MPCPKTNPDPRIWSIWNCTGSAWVPPRGNSVVDIYCKCNDTETNDMTGYLKEKKLGPWESITIQTHCKDSKYYVPYNIGTWKSSSSSIKEDWAGFGCSGNCYYQAFTNWDPLHHHYIWVKDNTCTKADYNYSCKCKNPEYDK